ncbi:MAG: hypothetical protein AB4426_07715 [Xenococcaceae cyanobacterium]
MKNTLTYAGVIAGTSLIFSATSAQGIGFGTYRLHNHPDGGVRPPLYGLRLDGLLTGNTREEYTFDFDRPESQMFLEYKDDGTIRIHGTAFGGEDDRNDYKPSTTAIWNINFLYQNVTKDSKDNGIVNLSPHSSTNSGTISTNAFGGLTYDLVDFSGNKNFSFRFGGKHRGAETSGWGWLNHGGPVDSNHPTSSTTQHIYASDWLFTAQKIPEPTSVLVLLAFGALGANFMLKHKKNHDNISN